MSGMNKVIVMGFVGSDPKVSDSSSKVVRFSVATNETWKNSKTQDQESHTEWHNLVCFGNVANIAEKYVSKGKQVLVEGKLRTNKFKNKEGIEVSSTNIIVDKLHLLGKSEGDQYKSEKQTSAKDYAKASGSDPADFDDEIPF